MRVPQYKVKGSRAELQCVYSLGNATLYSLKWYKGDKQFFQYIPANTITKNTFYVKGVSVDVSIYLRLMDVDGGSRVVLSREALGGRVVEGGFIV